MVTEINEKEIMTLRDLCVKHASKWFMYVIVGEMSIEDPESDMCYVVFTADTEEELYNHPYPERNIHNGGVSYGDKVEFPAEVGGMVRFH